MYLISCFWQHHPNKAELSRSLGKNSLFGATSMLLPASLLHASLLIPDFSPPWPLLSVCPRWNLPILVAGGCSWQRLAAVLPELQFLPTHMDRTGRIPTRSQENAQALAWFGVLAKPHPRSGTGNGRVEWKWKEAQTPGAAATRKSHF